MRTHRQSRFDVVIVGCGVTGLSTALHLKARGLHNIAIASDPEAVSQSSQALGALMGGQRDNITRFSHAYGSALASELWDFGDRSFRSVISYCKSKNLRFRQGKRLRLIVSESELIESKQAVSELQALGFAAKLWSKNQKDRRIFEGFSQEVLAVQEDSSDAAWINPSVFLRSLDDALGAVDRLPRISQISSSPDGVGVHCELGRFDAEVVVLANHLGMRELLPEMKDVLIPVAEQWGELAVSHAVPAMIARPGTVISWHHGYHLAVAVKEKCMNLAGARYLRINAGVGEEKFEKCAKIERHLSQEFDSLLKVANGNVVANSRVGPICIPCDELPVIGPMYGDDRILIAAGFMGSGLTQGFLAGKALADLIATGKSCDLPLGLWPRRLRSMRNSM